MIYYLQILKKCFALHGRCSREFFLAFLLCAWVYASAVHFFYLNILASLINFDIRYVLILPAMVAVVTVSAQRFRDFGWSGWFVLLGVVPGTYFLLPVFAKTISSAEYLKSFGWAGWFGLLLMYLCSIAFGLVLLLKTSDAGGNKYSKNPFNNPKVLNSAK